MKAATALYIHCSSLDFAPDCMRRWAARNLREEIDAAGFELRTDGRGIGAAVGTSVHRAAAVILEEKCNNGRLPPADVATDCAVETVREEIAKGVQYDQRITPSPAIAEAQSVRMARSYHTHVAPGIDPIHVEKRFEASIPWTVQPIVLTGQPDQVAREPDDVVDVKAGSRRSNHNAQLGGYSLVVRNAGLQVNAARIDWVPRAPIKHPQPRPVERKLNLSVAESAAINIVRQIDDSLTIWRQGDARRGLQAGDPAAFPSNPQSFLCGSKYCPAHSSGSNGWCRDWIRDSKDEP